MVRETLSQKKPSRKKAGRVAQGEVLSSSPKTTKKKRKKKKTSGGKKSKNKIGNRILGHRVSTLPVKGQAANILGFGVYSVCHSYIALPLQRANNQDILHR
jgi:hypothetical protein